MSENGGRSDDDGSPASEGPTATAAQPAAAGQDGRGAATGEQELDTKMLQIQSKRFYLDVKQNWRGRFIKIAEVGAGGRKSRLLMSMAAATEFRNRLTDFGEFYAKLGPATADSPPKDGQLKSEMMMKENRRYYLDLKENNRGRFLRVTQTNLRAPMGPRSQVAVPAQGIVELRDALTELLDKHGKDDLGFQGELPDAKHFRADNKMFYFDVGQNNRGVFMRISEVKQNFRTAITIPERSWSRFRDTFAELCDKMAIANEEKDEVAVAKSPADDAIITTTTNAAEGTDVN